MKLADLQQYESTKRIETRSTKSTRIRDLPQGRLIETGSGAYVVVETDRPSHRYHGVHAFEGLRSLTGRQFALLCHDPELAYLDLSRAVFLDTETTGLGLGVGTYVFLVGAGYFDGDAFRVKQFFLRTPSEEQAFLDGLSAFLCNFPAIVTFNGKAFDWPLLETRYVYHRDPMPLEDPPHLDLLHPARRLWKRRLESCALSSLEREILRAARTEEDVPGWMIPSLYFQYQRTGDPGPLQGVLYHNLQDILSLAILAIHMDRVMLDPLSDLSAPALDCYSLGRAFERSAETETALQCYEEALQRGLEEEHRIDCLRRLSTLFKRERRWHDATETWYRLVDEGGEAALFALIEMAKYHEHVARDYDQALDDVRQALLLYDLYPASALDTTPVELEHRLNRLVNKQNGVRTRQSWR